MKERTYFCIDMKSFFASVECAERGLNPFETNLIVADESRGNGTICLAITPKMKSLGVRNRCRRYEIPKNIQYITAMPRMQKYIDYAAEIYGIYLQYIDKQDIHVYSIDESFIDATDYLPMYHKTPKEFAKMLIDEIAQKLHIPATAGIGTNLYLAKIALDITAKKVPDHMGYLNEELFRETLWHHKPLTDFWGISTGTVRRLERRGITDMAGIAQYPSEMLYKDFGINAELLIDHSWGRESCLMSDIKNYKSKSKSVSSSQVLFEDYTFEKAKIVVEEMVRSGCLELMRRKVINIFNKCRKFDKGYLRSLMILDRKLLPSIGIETDGEVKYQPLGTFYSDEWQINQDSQWVKCSAVDRLMRLQKKTYVGFPLTENASLYDIAADILLNIGETADTFVISNDLKSVIVPMAFLPKGTAWDALQEIANAGLCKVFVDREDKINVRSEKEPKTTTAIRIDKSNMFSYSSSVSLTEFANRISVEYCDVSLSNDTVEAVSVELNIEPNASLELTLDYNTEVAYPAMETDNLNVLLTDFQGGVNACSVVAKNKTAQKQKAVLTVTGKAIEITTKSLTMQDDDSVRNNGVTEYSHPSSDLVQSHAQAEYIARILLERMHAGEGVITTTWRGNPKLNLGEKYESADRFGDSQELVCEYNKFTFDGGLKQETRGRTI